MPPSGQGNSAVFAVLSTTLTFNPETGVRGETGVLLGSTRLAGVKRRLVHALDGSRSFGGGFVPASLR